MLGVLGKDFKFKKISNLLTKEEIEVFKFYSHNLHRFHFNENFFAQDNDNSVCKVQHSFYADPFTEAFLMTKKHIIEKESGLSLLPTYSFFRVYTYGGELLAHTDRPSCEVSCTVQVSSDGTPWPFYADGEEFILNDGDGILYLGCEVEHERKQFKGDWHTQFFLHYVNQKGEKAMFAGDGRPMIGYPKK